MSMNLCADLSNQVWLLSSQSSQGSLQINLFICYLYAIEAWEYLHSKPADHITVNRKKNSHITDIRKKPILWDYKILLTSHKDCNFL